MPDIRIGVPDVVLDPLAKFWARSSQEQIAAMIALAFARSFNAFEAHGASMETLERRARYGGRKGRSARRRIAKLARRGAFAMAHYTDTDPSC